MADGPPAPLGRSVDRVDDRRDAIVGRMLAGLDSDFLQSRQTREVTTATWRVGVAGLAAVAGVGVGTPEPQSDRGGLGGRLDDDDDDGVVLAAAAIGMSEVMVE